MIKHRNLAACFYRRLKRPLTNEQIYSMDCQKTEPLPKLSIGAAYFKRQLGMNNFSIIKGGSNDSINKNTVKSFVWSENCAKKGVNEISSCVYHTLKNESFTEMITKIVMAMDNTVSTNKSQGMLGMASYYLFHHAPKHIKEVCITFDIFCLKQCFSNLFFFRNTEVKFCPLNPKQTVLLSD